MKVGKAIAFAAILIIGFVCYSQPASAAMQGGRITLHFDANMNFVGQQIRYCNGSSQHQGDITAPYYREEIYDCWTGVGLTGNYCERYGENWQCSYFYLAPGIDSLIATQYSLPSGVTLEQSCSILTCETFNSPEPRSGLEAYPMLGGFN